MIRVVASFVFALCLGGGAAPAAAITVTADTTAAPRFTVANAQVVCEILLDDTGHLARETLAGQRAWLATFGAENVRLEMDGGFAWDVMWNSWRSPGLTHNSDNPISIDHRGFRYAGLDKLEDGLVLHLRNDDLKLAADVAWRLGDDDFFIRRVVTLRDPKERGHRLLRAFGRRGAIHNSSALVKKGEYGQPVAFTVQDGGAFLGVEWPAATSSITPAGCGAFKLECYEDLEMPISATGVSGSATIAAVTPQPYVRLWFDRYVEAIRVAPVKPYLLYNSWYDLRSRDYVMEHLTGEERDVMTSSNILRVARDFQRRFCEPYGIPLDAFVLDDGWDVYESDWQLRGPEFPGGLRPVVDELKKMKTDLGIWFGPTGGYSYRQKRIDWMQQHGYEVTANNMLCVGGTNYHDLLKRRNLDLIREHGVGYFKWDGVQFACNAEGHGHPIGLASRRAVLDNVIDLSRTMRAANPDIYLNITSGTWLSPWWVTIANQIWMQGYDYGYADVPSLTARDAAMTYRDHVLHDDFTAQDCWFPIGNLMTHGIIKGYLERLGGEVDPLETFTDDVVMYFARGVSMWELYVSPNLLTDDEFKAIAETVAWAKDRFDILQHTVMIGGDPAKGEAYGYAHYLGDRGILALRNPSPRQASMTVVLDPAHGLHPAAHDLAVTRTYPWRGGLAGLHAAGEAITLTLAPFETQVWEIVPANQATEPLIGQAAYDIIESSGTRVVVHACAEGVPGGLTFLNGDLVRAVTIDGQRIDIKSREKAGPGDACWLPYHEVSAVLVAGSGSGGHPARSIDVYDVDPFPHRCAVLLESADSPAPDGSRVSARRGADGGRRPDASQVTVYSAAAGATWAGFITESVEPDATSHDAWQSTLFTITPDSLGKPWRGRATAMTIYDIQRETSEIVVTLSRPVVAHPMLPRPLPVGVFRHWSVRDQAVFD